MTDLELEKRLREALAHTAPDDKEEILSRCEERKERQIFMTTKQKKAFVRNLVAACLALALVGGGGVVYHQSYAVASVVSLDVNPSIELTVNQKGRVLACSPLNQEAGEILADMNGGLDLEGTKVDVAVNAVVGSLVRHGYLDSVSSAILISVEDRNGDRAARLRQELTSTVDSLLRGQSSDASVLSQTLTLDAQLDQQAKDTGISTGKAALVRQVLAVNSSLKFDALAELSVEELNDLLEAGVPAMPIGGNKAVELAEQYAGTTAMDTVRTEVDPELDDTPAHYEVELYHPEWGKFEYWIDAYTGAVLSGQADLMNHHSTQSYLAEEDARNRALEHMAAQYPELSAYNTLDLRVRLDRDEDGVHYDVEFYCGGYEFEYEIDAYTGAVLDWDTDDRPVPAAVESQKPAAAASGDVGEAAARVAALAHAGVREADAFDWETERDREDGRLEYEIGFKAAGWEYSYTIDGATGAVLEYEKDWDD